MIPLTGGLVYVADFIGLWFIRLFAGFVFDLLR